MMTVKYLCLSCGSAYTAQTEGRADKEARCPACGGNNVLKLDHAGLSGLFGGGGG